MYKDFGDLIASRRKNDDKKRVAVAAAQDEHTLEAVSKAARDGLVEPLLIGDKNKILTLLNGLDQDIPDHRIFDVKDDREAAGIAVALCRDKQADFIMKGKLQTADLLRAVVDKETGLRGERTMSHLGIFQVPAYHKILAITDGGMLLYPTLEEKKQLIENAVAAFHSLGYVNPKVAVLCAAEIINPKMQETLDADLLKKMNEKGELIGCIVEGPISYDLAIDEEAAKIKGFESPVAGDADILVVPNITAGNLLGKAIMYSAHGKMAGFIVGAKVPIVITSRGASSEEKYLSLALSASVSG